MQMALQVLTDSTTALGEAGGKKEKQQLWSLGCSEEKKPQPSALSLLPVRFDYFSCCWSLCIRTMGYKLVFFGPGKQLWVELEVLLDGSAVVLGFMTFLG